MIEFVPGMGHADIALAEIASGKLTFESTFGQKQGAVDNMRAMITKKEVRAPLGPAHML